MQNPQEDVKNQDPSTTRTVPSQTVAPGPDSNSSHGKGLRSDKNKR